MLVHFIFAHLLRVAHMWHVTSSSSEDSTSDPDSDSEVDVEADLEEVLTARKTEMARLALTVTPFFLTGTLSRAEWSLETATVADDSRVVIVVPDSGLDFDESA